MGSGIFNLVVGGAAIAAGLSGRFSFIGTNSPTLLVVIGAGIAGFGVYQIIKARRK